jgi:hypothetical protein
MIGLTIPHVQKSSDLPPRILSDQRELFQRHPEEAPNRKQEVVVAIYGGLKQTALASDCLFEQRLHVECARRAFFYDAHLGHDGINELRRRHVKGRIPDLYAFRGHRHSLGGPRHDGALKKRPLDQSQLPVRPILYRDLLSALLAQIY